MASRGGLPQPARRGVDNFLQGCSDHLPVGGADPISGGILGYESAMFLDSGLDGQSSSAKILSMDGFR